MIVRAPRAAMIASWVAACSPAPRSLAELEDPVLVVHLGERRTSLGLFAQVEVTVRHARAYAALTTRLDGTLDGGGLEVVTRGEAPGAGALSFGANPSLQAVVAFRDAATSTLVVSDGTATFAVTVAAMLSPRSIAVEQPADGVVRPGRRVELAYAPGSDTLDLAACRVQLVSSALWDLGPCASTELAVQTARGHVGFTVPRTILGLPTTRADAALRLDVGRRPQVISCVGVTACEVTGRWTEEAPIHLEGS